jgi:hypothetical protein
MFDSEKGVAHIRIYSNKIILCVSELLQNSNSTSCFVWVFSLVCHMKGRSQTEGVSEQGAEENVWTYEE